VRDTAAAVTNEHDDERVRRVQQGVHGLEHLEHELAAFREPLGEQAVAVDLQKLEGMEAARLRLITASPCVR